jgi:site-specific DNA recombinase
MITAEYKIKRQKNGNVHYYTYYRCTKRLSSNCTQKPVRLEDLETQISEIINNITIPAEFHDWAMKWFKKDSEKEAENRNEILKNQKKKYNDCIKEIDGLISMRAKGELDEDNYKRKIVFLNQEKSRLQELLEDTDDRVNKLIAKAEKIFDLARDSKKIFETGDLDAKRRVLSDLGYNLLLKDRKLSISIQKPLIYIEQAAPIAWQLKRRLEPVKTGDYQAKLEDLYSKNAFLGG